VLTRGSSITIDDLPPEIVRPPRAAPQAVVAPEWRERRRTVGDVLFERLTAGASFWDAVHQPYVARDIRKADVRAVVHKGLEVTRELPCGHAAVQPAARPVQAVLELSAEA